MLFVNHKKTDTSPASEASEDVEIASETSRHPNEQGQAGVLGCTQTRLTSSASHPQGENATIATVKPEISGHPNLADEQSEQAY